MDTSVFKKSGRMAMMAALSAVGAGALTGGFGNQTVQRISEFMAQILFPWQRGGRSKHKVQSRTSRVSHKAEFRAIERRRRAARALQRSLARVRGLNRAHT